MRLAVRLTLVVEKTAVHKRSETFPAHKTLGVPERTESRDVILQDGSGTTATFGGKHVKVVFSAVRLALLFMETVRAKE